MDYFPTFTAFFRSIKRLPRPALGLFTGRLLQFDAAMLFRQLASMLRAGVPLPQALAFLGDEFSERARRRLHAVRNRVERGERFSEALDSLPDRWVSRAWRATVAAGERAGRLPEILDQLAEEGETLTEIGQKVRSVMAYPLAVLIFAGLVIDVILWKAMPVLGSLYEQCHSNLPWGTSLIANSWRYVQWPYFVVIAVVLGHAIARMLFPNAALPLSWLARILAPHVPVARGLHRAAIEVRFARTLRLLLDSGVALPDALGLCEGVVSDTNAGREIADAARRIREGDLPSQALGEIGAVSPAFLWFLAGSEQRGDFLDVTAAMAESAEERLATQLDLAERVLEPASIVAVGLIVGFVVVHFYWPMYRLISLTGNE